jgi:hypothetical protein
VRVAGWKLKLVGGCMQTWLGFYQHTAMKLPRCIAVTYTCRLHADRARRTQIPYLIIPGYERGYGSRHKSGSHNSIRMRTSTSNHN